MVLPALCQGQTGDGEADRIIADCIELNGLSSPWSCGVCKSHLAKVATDVEKNSARIGNVELFIYLTPFAKK